MTQHDVSPALACAPRYTMMRCRLVGFLLVVAGGIALICAALSFLPGLTACTPLIHCGRWYPFILFGILFVVVGMVLARPRVALLTDEEVRSQQLYKELLAEYARWWVIFTLFVSTLLILGGAATLFSFSSGFAWVWLVVGNFSMLLGLGVLLRACLSQREERFVAAAHEREHQFRLSLSPMTHERLLHDL